MSSIGKVYITGAGPGDEKLITVKAVECLKKADVVIYDYLVNETLLKYCKAGCEKIYAGKKAKNHTMEQGVINNTIVNYALEGKTVVRLKGGDPYVFGRGGEETLALYENNIPFEVIPGITAGVGVPSYAGIPVTHRDCGPTLTFISGHESKEKPESDIDWPALSKLRGTLVFYMGVTNLPKISSKLIENGMPAQTPVALIRWGTTHQQFIICGTLADITTKAENVGFKPPALIVIGETVNYREKLNWFEKRELFGRRILVTRSRKQSSALSQHLSDLGAEVVELPTIDIQPYTDYSQLDKAIWHIEEYQWIAFTSVNAIEYFMERLKAANKDSRALYKNKIAVIGEETALVLSSYGIRYDLLPARYTSEVVAETFKSYGLAKGDKILLPSSKIARETLPSALAAIGAVTECIPVYDNVIPCYEKEYLDKLFSRPFDLVTFTSSSTVANLVQLLQSNDLENYLGQLKGVSIGPVTTKTAEELNIPVVAEANPHTIPGLVEAVMSYFKKA